MCVGLPVVGLDVVGLVVVGECVVGGVGGVGDFEGNLVGCCVGDLDGLDEDGECVGCDVVGDVVGRAVGEGEKTPMQAHRKGKPAEPQSSEPPPFRMPPSSHSVPVLSGLPRLHQLGSPGPPPARKLPQLSEPTPFPVKLHPDHHVSPMTPWLPSEAAGPLWNRLVQDGAMTLRSGPTICMFGSKSYTLGNMAGMKLVVHSIGSTSSHVKG
jgi:hypothetical protein